jgi:hypothetical protein
MEEPELIRSGTSGDPETHVSHFIPAVELKGSRAEKLQALDTLIAQLEQLRRSLAGTPTKIDSAFERWSPYIDRPTGPWLVAGALLAAVFIILLLAALGGAL